MSSNIAITTEPEGKNKKGLKSDPFIFSISVGFIVVFVIATIALGEKARTTFSAIAGWLLENLGWMYIGVSPWFSFSSWVSLRPGMAG